MEKNVIIDDSPYSEEIYRKYLLEVTSNLKKFPFVNIRSKLLHYLYHISFYYYITAYKSTKINLFNIDILFCLEFIDGEIPYATIMTDFTESSLNDNRNYYRCLTKEHNYIFHINKYKEQEKILENIICNGIENFLLFLNESIILKTFIFFGEYEYKHIYQINDFLQNKNNYFYRIRQIIDNKEEERYILFTKLYFILFEPLSHDKTLVKILFYIKLKEMNVSCDRNDIKNSLILLLSQKNFDDKIEFVFIDRKRTESINETYKKSENKKGINNKGIYKKDSNKKEINTENPNIKDITTKENKKIEETDINKKKIKTIVKFDYSLFIKNFYIYLDAIDFRNYNNVINKYKMIFNEYRGNLQFNNKIKGEKKNLDELNKLIMFYENIVLYYENKKETKYNERMHKIISNIIYICSELIIVAKNQKKDDNEYLLKVKKYLNMYK